MRRVQITVHCVADLTELWTIDVPDDYPEIDEDNYLDVIDGKDGAVHVSVDNIAIDGERDREFASTQDVESA